MKSHQTYHGEEKDILESDINYNTNTKIKLVSISIFLIMKFQTK